MLNREGQARPGQRSRLGKSSEDVVGAILEEASKFAGESCRRSTQSATSERQVGDGSDDTAGFKEAYLQYSRPAGTTSFRRRVSVARDCRPLLPPRSGDVGRGDLALKLCPCSEASGDRPRRPGPVRRNSCRRWSRADGRTQDPHGAAGRRRDRWRARPRHQPASTFSSREKIFYHLQRALHRGTSCTWSLARIDGARKV